MNVIREMLRLWMNGGIPCVFRLWTGLYCPGCGGTRAVKALLRGKVFVSFLYHPLVLYSAVIAAWFAVSYCLYWRTRNPKFRLFLNDKIIYAGVGIIVVNFFVKNYFLIARGIDILERLPKM